DLPAPDDPAPDDPAPDDPAPPADAPPLPSPPPAPAAAPAPTTSRVSTTSRASTTWTVARGDSFWRIAKATLSAAWGRPPADREVVPYWHEVVAANRGRLHDRDPDLIFPGQVFELPPPPTA